MRTLSRRLTANLLYLRKPTFQFLPILAGMTVVMFVGGFAFRNYYPDEVQTLSEGLYVTYCLIFMEHLLEFPEHRLLQVFYIVLPPLGLVVILDGIEDCRRSLPSGSRTSGR